MVQFALKNEEKIKIGILYKNLLYPQIWRVHIWVSLYLEHTLFGYNYKEWGKERLSFYKLMYTNDKLCTPCDEQIDQ